MSIFSGSVPAAVEKSTSLGPQDLALPSAEVRKRIQALADAGVGFVLLPLRPPYDREALRRFAKEVMPEFRKG